jgi:hypothetical protein
MSIESILVEIDREIARLREVRALLSPNKSLGKDRTFSIHTPRKRRKMSADARKRIADAQRKRWAEQKKRAK